MTGGVVSASADGVPERRFACPAEEVTLMEDRARVLRRGRLRLFASRLRLRIPEVSTALVDKSLKASLRGPQGELPIHQIAVRRERVRVGAASPEAFAELKKRRDALLREVAREKEAQEREEALLARLHELYAHAIEEIEEDVAWGRGEPAGWERSLSEIAARQERALADRHKRSLRIEELAGERGRLDARIEAAMDPPKERIAWVEIECVIPEEGEHELTLSYLVPGACWRPAHRAELVEREGRSLLLWRAEACVWQNTGERWEEVRVSCSTQRPSLGAEPPALQTDRLAVRRKREVEEVELREQQIQHTGLGAGAAKAAAPEVPGIDDGGEALSLVAEGLATVLSDGRPHRLPLFSFESEAELSAVCAPELELAISRRSEQLQGASRPLLAGPVDLIREGGFIGRTQIPYVAPKERFELGWGPDSALRVRREREEMRSDSSFFGSWTTRVYRVRVSLSNLGPEKRRLTLSERIPVSEIEKVQIQVDTEQTTLGREASAEGILRWEIELSPLGQKQIELRYRIKQHSDIVGAVGQ